MNKIIIDTREKLLAFLSRYYNGKGLLLEMVTIEATFEVADQVQKDSYYYLFVLKKKYEHVEFYKRLSVVKAISINETLFQEVMKLLTDSKLKGIKLEIGNKDTLPVEDFLRYVTTRPEKIERSLRKKSKPINQ